MKRVIFDSTLLIAILVFFPCAVFGQDDVMSFSEDEVKEGEAAPASEGEGEAGTMSFEEGASEDSAAGGEAEAAAEGGADFNESDILSALGEDETGGGEAAAAGAAGKKTGEAEEAGPPEHPIWAVQRVYVLRARRVDLQPTVGISLNDPYRQHYAINLSLAYHITEVLAVGVSFNFYRWLATTQDLNFEISRATHQKVPINEYFWGGQLNFTYVPIYGKFAMFKQWILHWDVWLIGGGGFIWTAPIPTIDAEFRDFDYTIKFCFNVGIGGRLFLTRSLAILLELRDYIFPEELESLTKASNDEDRADEKNWLDDDYKITNNVMLNIGITLFVPFTFEYRLKK